MPFLNHDHKPIIRHPQGHPVSVIVAFNTVGDLIPRYFCVEDDNCELFKYKIDAIKAIKDKPGVKIFECVYIAYGFKNTITLCFDIINTIWVIG
ncbi:MAG: hypothetical protein K0R92_542 [Lachnospiraceae bacterium]|jgi:hypothetical protein|nr:hypothetical protein [Lachnospiraceae bacterium]